MKKALLALATTTLLLTACSSADDNLNPAKNTHAAGCAKVGGAVKEHEQYGGKYKTSTYWCARPDGQITDIWFEK